jgi:(1->4)-alpha-D-glucan 1-alpha-D-glucosylmutase
MKVQQVTGPVMAKAVEDTAFYRFPRFLAENEVGGHPAHLGVSVDELHRLNAERLARFPTALLATATHDTKLGEDTRARIAVFSEAPDLLGQLTKELDAAAVGRFGEKVPAPVDRFRLAQAAVGVWPLDPRGREGLGERLAAYAVKAAREAKLHTSWLDPDGEYEEVLTTYARALVDDAALRAPVDAVASRIAAAGVSNSLAQLALRLCSPGVPDTYQGAELWHQCLVDPDNRSAVDYAARRAALRRIQEPGAGEAAVRALRDHWDDGLLKLLVLHRGLELRARHAELFAAGDYGPVDGGAHAIAFVRSRGPHAVLCAVARRPFRLAGERLPVGDVWGNRRLPGLDGRRWRDAFTGRALTSERNGLPLAELFATLPVAVAVAE